MPPWLPLTPPLDSGLAFSVSFEHFGIESVPDPLYSCVVFSVIYYGALSLMWVPKTVDGCFRTKVFRASSENGIVIHCKVLLWSSIYSRVKCPTSNMTLPQLYCSVYFPLIASNEMEFRNNWDQQGFLMRKEKKAVHIRLKSFSKSFAHWNCIWALSIQHVADNLAL